MTSWERWCTTQFYPTRSLLCNKDVTSSRATWSIAVERWWQDVIGQYCWRNSSNHSSTRDSQSNVSSSVGGYQPGLQRQNLEQHVNTTTALWFRCRVLTWHRSRRRKERKSEKWIKGRRKNHLQSLTYHWYSPGVYREREREGKRGKGSIDVAQKGKKLRKFGITFARGTVTGKKWIKNSIKSTLWLSF